MIIIMHWNPCGFPMCQACRRKLDDRIVAFLKQPTSGLKKSWRTVPPGIHLAKFAKCSHNETSDRFLLILTKGGSCLSWHGKLWWFDVIWRLCSVVNYWTRRFMNSPGWPIVHHFLPHFSTLAMVHLEDGRATAPEFVALKLSQKKGARELYALQMSGEDDGRCRGFRMFSWLGFFGRWDVSLLGKPVKDLIADSEVKHPHLGELWWGFQKWSQPHTMIREWYMIETVNVGVTPPSDLNLLQFPS